MLVHHEFKENRFDILYTSEDDSLLESIDEYIQKHIWKHTHMGVVMTDGLCTNGLIVVDYKRDASGDALRDLYERLGVNTRSTAI